MANIEYSEFSTALARNPILLDYIVTRIEKATDQEKAVGKIRVALKNGDKKGILTVRFSNGDAALAKSLGILDTQNMISENTIEATVSSHPIRKNSERVATEVPNKYVSVKLN